MSIPYATATSGDKALVETQRVLAKFGCSSFGTAIDAERGVTIVSFKHRGRVVRLEASWKGYAAALMLDSKPPSYSSKRADMERRALEQARVSVCSILRDWVKGQVTAIECGVLSFEAAFMPHMLLSDGRRVLDAARSEGLLPAALPAPEDKP